MKGKGSYVWIKGTDWVYRFSARQDRNEVEMPAPGISVADRMKLVAHRLTAVMLELYEARRERPDDPTIRLVTGVISEVKRVIEDEWLDKEGELVRFDTLDEYEAAHESGEIGWNVGKGGEAAEGSLRVEAGRVASDAADASDEVDSRVSEDA